MAFIDNAMHRKKTAVNSPWNCVKNVCLKFSSQLNTQFPDLTTHKHASMFNVYMSQRFFGFLERNISKCNYISRFCVKLISTVNTQNTQKSLNQFARDIFFCIGFMKSYSLNDAWRTYDLISYYYILIVWCIRNRWNTNLLQFCFIFLFYFQQFVFVVERQKRI